MGDEVGNQEFELFFGIAVAFRILVRILLAEDKRTNKQPTNRETHNVHHLHQHRPPRRTITAHSYTTAVELVCQQVTGGDDDLVCGLVIGLVSQAVTAVVEWLAR